jgi:hypothetical protein
MWPITGAVNADQAGSLPRRTTELAMGRQRYMLGMKKSQAMGD